MRYNYTKDLLKSALRELSLGSGDTVLIHSDIAALGIPYEFVKEKRNISALIYETVRETIGPDGTLIVPTFSYSFCKGEDFNVAETPSDVGNFSNYVRLLPGTIRSHDPLFSFAAIGPNANLISNFSGNNSFSPKSSAFKNFYDVNIKMLFLGVTLSVMTAAHFAEQLFSAPYRFDKLFSGNIIDGDKTKKIRWIYPVRVNVDHTRQKLIQLHEDCLEAGLLKKSAALPIFCGNMREILDHFIIHAKDDPWRYIQGPQCDLEAEDQMRTGYENFNISLPSTDLETMARILTPLPRHLISDGYDAALFALAEKFPMKIHSWPTGYHAFTWIVPERWHCRRASLKTMDGRYIFSLSNSPFHVISYSKPFNGLVAREELFSHLYTPKAAVAERKPDAIPFIFKYYERDWGLCCSAKQKAELTDEKYRVEIDSDYSIASLKVGEAAIEGSSKACIVFCAHLCHPGQFNDGLSGVLAGLKLMERLRKRRKFRYSYRMLVLPETIGSACWLSSNMDIVPNLKGGVFLEMLATNQPHVLMHSNTPESHFDRLVSLVLKEEDRNATEVPFLEAPLNDERMFNAAGINCPMSSLMRIAPRDDAGWPYDEYHTSLDNCDSANFDNLSRSVDLLERLVDALEADAVPQLLWKGELFVSRFNGLNYERDGAMLREIIYSVDGKRRISDIARMRNLSFFGIKRVLDILEKENLLEYAEAENE